MRITVGKSLTPLIVLFGRTGFLARNMFRDVNPSEKRREMMKGKTDPMHCNLHCIMLYISTYKCRDTSHTFNRVKKKERKKHIIIICHVLFNSFGVFDTV